LGQEVSDKTSIKIAVALEDIDPFEDIDIHYVPVAGNKQAIVLLVEPGKKAPYTYDGRPYIRNQSTTLRMPKEYYLGLHHTMNPTIFEGLTNNNCTIEDLDQERIRAVVRMAVFKGRLPEDFITKSIPDILDELSLTISDKPTNAAVILFCKDQRKQFNQSNLQLARWKGIDDSEFLNMKLYKANAFDLYDKAEEFLVSTLPLAARIVPGQSERVETPAIPYSVLREALVNAFIHRDYFHPGTSTSVSIYDDRVAISNPGFLPEGVNVELLSHAHKSVQRNPLIAHVFFVWGKIEKFGRGTTNMIRDCKAVGNPIPIFEEIGGGFSVTLPLKESIRTITYQEAQEIKLTDRQKDILNVLRLGQHNRSQIIKKIDVKLTDRVVQKELAKLKEMGLVKSEGKGKAIVWVSVI